MSCDNGRDAALVGATHVEVGDRRSRPHEEVACRAPNESPSPTSEKKRQTTGHPPRSIHFSVALPKMASASPASRRR
jgi:hypothetical protein